MKIAIVTGVFPKTSETFILNQITGLMNLGHSVNVFAFREGKNEISHSDIKKYDIHNKLTYFDIPENRIERLSKFILILLRYSYKHFKKIKQCLNITKYSEKYHALNNLFVLMPFLKKKYDIIHCHFGPIGNKLIFLKDIFPSMKFITTFHGYDIRLGLENGGTIYKNLFAKVDFIIAICRKMQEILITKLGCPQNKVIYNPIGINIESFKNGTSSKKNGLFIITSVGRLAEEKNIATALKSIHLLRESTALKFRYHLIGDGYLNKNIKQIISDLTLANIVTMHGALAQDKIIEILNGTDIFLLTSKAEMLPNALLEAQAMSIPVIATDVGGVKEAMQDNVSGYLISDFNDAEEIKNKLLALMTNPSLIANMGKQGRKFIEENYDLEKLNNRLANFYKNLLAN